MAITILTATYGIPGVSGLDVKSNLEAHLQKNNGCLNLSPEIDPNVLFGKDPIPARQKCLYIHYRYSKNRERKIAIPEFACKFTHPIYIHPFGSLDFVLDGGLTNQMYGVASAMLIAHKLQRTVAVQSFKWIARRNELDRCMGIGAWENAAREGYLVPLSNLFDEQTFTKRFASIVSPSSLCQNGTSRHITPWLSRPALSSDAINKHFYAACQHLTIRNPFWSVAPSKAQDYHLMVGVFNALVPCDKLNVYVQSIQAQLANKNVCAIHYRSEKDWMQQCPSLKDPLQLELRRITPLPLFQDASTIYIAGKVASAVLQQIKSALLPRTVLYKTDVIVDLESKLGFEELAVVDREICLRSTSFVGNSWSTFSLSICVQRRLQNCAFYSGRLGYSTCDALLFNMGGKLLIDSLPP